MSARRTARALTLGFPASRTVRSVCSLSPRLFQQPKHTLTRTVGSAVVNTDQITLKTQQRPHCSSMSTGVPKAGATW